MLNTLRCLPLPTQPPSDIRALHNLLPERLATFRPREAFSFTRLGMEEVVVLVSSMVISSLRTMVGRWLTALIFRGLSTRGRQRLGSSSPFSVFSKMELLSAERPPSMRLLLISARSRSEGVYD